MKSTEAAPVPQTATDWVLLAREIGATLAPGVAERDRDGEISVSAFRTLRETGITSALVPAEHGGGGASHAGMGRVLRELGRRDAATAVTLSMHAHLLAAQVWRHRHGMDATVVFRKVVGNRAVLISTGASDWVASSGSARRVEGGYQVSARKAPASGCEVGDVLVTSVRFEDGPEGPRVLHCSIPLHAEGVRIERTWDTLGLRATGSHTVVLEDVFLPDAAVSLDRPADRWHPVWNTVLGAAMPLILSAYLGIADAAVDLAREAAAGRQGPHVHPLLGEMVNAHTTADDLIAAMFRDSDDLRFANTDGHAARTLARKTVASDALVQTVRLALEVAGGAGYSRGSDLERLYRDVHGCLFHPLPRAKQTLFTGRVLAGLSPIA
ncbi:acyl-CoA dehydrogenase [Acidobacteria bacterium ACD]|nr:MAG: acyl-CoA dehydrogenase [Acidobacteriota bacterium]MCE7959294.1 acyl-CoA dehydrogenase [Acidobacteria bacterium ACB2]MDL1949770.1 acyl-CoA dehydrogenase [Acidobacteria bacterium ACD]